MGDLLVKLYELPDAAPALAAANAAGFFIKRPLPSQSRAVISWVEREFGERWAGEAATAFARTHPAMHIAEDGEGRICGFACHDVTFRGFFGPTGVTEKLRGRGIGTALLHVALHALATAGYAYAIIGWSGDDDFYRKSVGATPIPGSEPGPYGPWRS